MAEGEQAYAGWAILELMGHRRLGGYVREVTFAGAGLIRIDVPGKDGDPAATQMYSPGALYCLTPCSEEVARAVAIHNQPEPVTRWELPAPKPQPATVGADRDWAVERSEDDDELPDIPFS